MREGGISVLFLGCNDVGADSKRWWPIELVRHEQKHALKYVFRPTSAPKVPEAVMSDAPEKGHPIQMALIVVLLIGGGWYFFKHYNIDGLDGVAIKPKAEFAWEKLDDPFTFTSSTDARESLDWPVDESGNPIEADPVIYSPSDMLRSGRRRLIVPGGIRFTTAMVLRRPSRSLQSVLLSSRIFASPHGRWTDLARRSWPAIFAE